MSRKIVAVLVSIVMCMALFVACAQTTDTTATTTATASVEEPSVEETEQSTEAATESTDDLDGTGLKFGFSTSDVNSDYMVSSFQIVQDVCTEHGVEVNALSAEYDSELQLQQIESFIAQGVDAILVFYVDKDAIISGVQAANEAQIPIVFIDRLPSEDMQDAHVDAAYGFDDSQMAYDGCMYIINKAKEDGIEHLYMFEVVGSLNSTQGIARSEGCNRAVEDNSDYVEIVATGSSGEWEQPLVLSATVNALEAHPEINAIYCPSDYLLTAVISGLEQQGKLYKYGDLNHIYLASHDGFESALDYVADGTIDAVACQDVTAEAENCVMAAIKLAKGIELEEELVVSPGLTVTRDNFMDVAYDTWSYKMAGRTPGDIELMTES